VRDVRHHLRSKRGEGFGEERGSGDTVCVEIPIDSYQFAGPNGVPDSGHGVGYTPHEEGVSRLVSAGQESVHLRNGVETSIVQTLHEYGGKLRGGGQEGVRQRGIDVPLRALARQETPPESH
jgi:hypothetical protein